jgi:CheY-like chemotaxis protein
MRILIIEDSSASRLLLSKMVKSIIPNTHITLSVNGKNALIKLSSEIQFDLIILDLGLPDIGGLQILELIKDFNIACPIITISDEGNQEALKESLALGAVSYITKPLNKTQLLNVFNEHIQIKGLLDNKKILIVDDDEANRELLKRRVESKDYDVQTTSNGFEAINMTKRNIYSCILMDIRMPYMDGFEATEIIRRDYPDIPIIFVTAEPYEDVIERCNEVGGNLLLTKPFNKETLFTSIDEMIKNNIEKIKKIFKEATLLLDEKQREETGGKSNVLENFMKFIPESFVEHTNLHKPIERGLTHIAEYSVIVIDLRELKKMISSLDAEKCFKFLNSYCDMVEPVVKSFGGMIHQFLGSHLICFFPLYKDKFTNNAIHAAASIQDQITIYNRGRKRAGYEPISIGCGISTGEIAVGICGSSTKYEIGIFGEIIDKAINGQLICSEFGIDISISEDTYNKIENADSFLIRPIGDHKLQGQELKTSLYEVFSHNHPIIRQNKRECLEYIKESQTGDEILPIDELAKRFPLDPIWKKLKSIKD